jgi:hypothetical protein
LPLPRWFMIVVSVFIVFHFSSVVVRVLATQSGPWASMDGGAMPAMPPRFAWKAYQSLPGQYLHALQMPYDYHFVTDQTRRIGVYLEARLKDQDGKEIARLKFPDENASSWVRHRQQLLMDKLTDDVPVQVPMTERVAAPGQQTPMVTIWENYERNKMRLKTQPLNDLITNSRQQGPVFQPSDLTWIYARAFARYVCRTHGAAKVEIVRVHQNPIQPEVLFNQDVPSEMFDPNYSTFGELSR